MYYRNGFYHIILEGYKVGQTDPAKINVLDAINFAILAWTTNVHFEEIVDIIGKSNVDDEVEDDTIPLELVTRKESLITSKTLHNFMVQFEKTIPKLFDAIRKVRDELQLDLNLAEKGLKYP
ncbi:hypothetical protein R3W88_032147 [Solanum pinnatisectum]|uniref:Uncharacterized protein n=1 Tax=Solanum pinnatisectum TaxID=50273 RepID=A0AAV9LQZ7_9SOLN|nr:hypothetical protein R3W88_032147 [Solanum pinnatisectum]